MGRPELAIAWLWLGGSLFLAVLWANLAWFFRRPRPGALGELVTRLIAWRFSPWLLQLLRLLYYVGVPYAALLWSHDAIIEDLLGLGAATWLEWARDVGWAITLGIGAFTLLASGWWAYRRALVAAGEGNTVAGANSSGWVLLREAAYHEVHWAFYRNAPIVVWKNYTGDVYGGVWAGLMLVALEAVLNPAWRNKLTNPQKAPAQLMRGALAVVSSALFLLTGDGNLWLALALHWGVSWSLTMLVQTLPLPTCKRDSVTT